MSSGLETRSTSGEDFPTPGPVSVLLSRPSTWTVIVSLGWSPSSRRSSTTSPDHSLGPLDRFSSGTLTRVASSSVPVNVWTRVIVVIP